MAIPPDDPPDLPLQSTHASSDDASALRRRPGQELPTRYVCQTCGTCIATSESLLDTRDDVLVFSHLYAAIRADKGSTAVACPVCEQALGSRTDASFPLRKERLVKRVERLEILVCSLKAAEISSLAPVLQEVFPHCNITTRVLMKAELRGFQSFVPKAAPDLVVVVHRNEGRALLTDRNGFYHDVLGTAWQYTRGNVLVVLTKVEPKSDGLYDEAMLRALSTQGDQPTIGAIAAIGRCLTWESAPSRPQLDQLSALTSKAYFREPPEPAPGVPGLWTRPPSKAASAWCALL